MTKTLHPPLAATCLRAPGAGPTFLARQDACRGTGKRLIQRTRARQAASAARPAGQAADPCARPIAAPSTTVPLGGATRSKHMDGGAFDIAMTNLDPGGVRGGGARGRIPRLRLLSVARGSSKYEPLGPRVSGGERFPVPGDSICSRDAALRAKCCRSAGTMKRRRGGRVWRRWVLRALEVAQSVPGRDPVRHSAARAISRHAPLGVHRAWRSGGSRSRSTRGLDDWEAGPPMIGASSLGFAHPTRGPGRLCATAPSRSQCSLFLFALRRSGVTHGPPSPNVSKNLE